jgi:hypothetical protein
LVATESAWTGPHDGLRRGRRGADPGRGRDAQRRTLLRTRWRPYPADHRSLGDRGGVEPAREHLHRTQFYRSVGQGDKHPFGLGPLAGGRVSS